MPPDWEALTVDKQLANTGSTLAFFRRALELRRTRVEFTGDRVEWVSGPRRALIFRYSGLVCVLNAGKDPLALPEGELILSSAPLVGGQLAENAAAWLV
jgi:alpha-glucosidase